MSFWAATVITNLFSAIPIIGIDLVLWLWSGYSVSGVTLTKFYSLHYLLPFIILLLVIIHIYLLHLNGSNNPIGINLIKLDSISFFPYYSSKDIFGIIFYIFLAINIILIFPNLLGHSDNYIQANPMITPAHIVPEWYLLPFYAILRSIPNKLLGVIGMILALVILMFIPILFKSSIRTIQFKPLSKIIYWFFLIILIQLGIIGGKTAENPYIFFGQILTILYFLYFILFQPIINNIEFNFWNNIKYKKNFIFLTFFINIDNQLINIIYSIINLIKSIIFFGDLATIVSVIIVIIATIPLTVYIANNPNKDDEDKKKKKEEEAKKKAAEELENNNKNNINNNNEFNK